MIQKIQNTSAFQTIKVNPMSDYDYLSKQQIYDIRKNLVKNSLFASKNYEPAKPVFGAIADNKPWWGTTSCNQLNYKGDYHERIEGPSKVSAQMNNPNALVGLSLPFLPWQESFNEEFCTGTYSRFLPISIQYSEKDNLIVAKLSFIYYTKVEKHNYPQFIIYEAVSIYNNSIFKIWNVKIAEYRFLLYHLFWRSSNGNK